MRRATSTQQGGDCVFVRGVKLKPPSLADGHTEDRLNTRTMGSFDQKRRPQDMWPPITVATPLWDTGGSAADSWKEDLEKRESISFH